MSDLLADLGAIEDKINEINELTELVELASNRPRMRVRVNVSKNSKGYTPETSVEVEWENSTNATSGYLVTSPSSDGGKDSVALDTVLHDLLQTADRAAREEIKRRELLDGTSS